MARPSRIHVPPITRVAAKMPGPRCLGGSAIRGDVDRHGLLPTARGSHALAIPSRPARSLRLLADQTHRVGSEVSTSFSRRAIETSVRRSSVDSAIFIRDSSHSS